MVPAEAGTPVDRRIPTVIRKNICPSLPKLLAFAGSTRKDSLNKLLVKIAAKGAESAGAQVTFLDLKDYPLPLYDGDLENRIGHP